MLWWTLKGSVILALAFAATALLRRRPAAVRHAVWTVAVAAQLLLPFGTKVVPEETLAVAVPARIVSLPAVMADLPARAAPAPAPPRFTPDWTMLAIAGSALLVLRLLYGTLRIAAISRSAKRVHDGEWLSLCGQLCDELGIARPVTLARSERISLPITWGVFYPAILLPETSHKEWPDALRRHVLLHELAHVRRGDALSQLIAQAALALFWFNPLLWLAVRQMRADAEHASDDYVLRDGERPSRYATSLVELVRAHTGHRVPAFAALSVGGRSDLEQRVAAITHPLRDTSVRRALFASAVIVALVIVVPLSALHPKKEQRAAVMAASSIACKPLFVEDADFRETSGMLTMNGRSTYYFFLRPESDRCLEASFPLDTRFAENDRELVPTRGLDALVHETVNGIDRAVYITEANGALRYRYLVNGDEAHWDLAARMWFQNLLPHVIRRTYAGVDDRVQRIMREGGLEGLCDELQRMPLVDVRERYISAVLPLLPPDQMPRAELIERAKPHLDSFAPTWATFLAHVMTRDGAREDVREAVLAEAEKIEPSNERVPVIVAMLEHADPAVREAGFDELKPMHAFVKDGVLHVAGHRLSRETVERLRRLP